MITLLFLAAFAVCAAVIWIGAEKKGLTYWLPADLLRTLRLARTARHRQVTHLMFAFVDHFEPGNRKAGPEKQAERVAAWINDYPKLAGAHRDSDGIPPQHTFFFPPHYDTQDHLERLVGLCAQGYGEIEMHLHHDRGTGPWPDDEESLRRKIIDCRESFARLGVFCLPDGRKTFSFIHGDWALANSRKGGAHCGVNDELTLLEEAGCYADFTFPVSNESQPALANTIFYARSGKERPKGYDATAVPLRAGRKPAPGLLLIQGVIGLRWKSRTHSLRPSIEQSNICAIDSPTPQRIDYWVNKRIHVPGRPDWIFVKVHCHGSREEDRDALIGRTADAMYHYLESAYNDGERYRLHYVSAREMYNIVKAAEDGKQGNPHQYRDYLVPRYVYLPDRENQEGRR
ncbi:hypothetical protein [Geomesophilobacter sediminis]|uniref:Uncharacterized protein n=1 Tax=Geomesophilobacter sediminis TaxID=2798584 RepID=A0A8J7LXT0_9BACT|nr:hypothetical protein [Geomesophilobacter sediminis]MBJ6723682.1 hypothetical protein [Geomesophilobacter sediminis]